LWTKRGNFFDQTHLLVALWRAAGIDARYAHGPNKWWGQCIINGKTYDCDPTNQKHEFGRRHHPIPIYAKYYEELDH